MAHFTHSRRTSGSFSGGRNIFVFFPYPQNNCYSMAKQSKGEVISDDALFNEALPAFKSLFLNYVIDRTNELRDSIAEAIVTKTRMGLPPLFEPPFAEIKRLICRLPGFFTFHRADSKKEMLF